MICPPPPLPNFIGSIDGSGTKRSPCIHTGTNQNLNKISKLVSFLFNINYLFILISTHSPSAAPPSSITPIIGTTTAERLRDRGFDCCIRSDDCPQHPKTYRQISSTSAKTPSRDAPPADTPNIHPPSSERSGKLKYSIKGGSTTAFPITETTNPDTTELIATNIISITDGQFHSDKKLSLDSIRPGSESASSASRTGGAAQSR